MIVHRTNTTHQNTIYILQIETQIKKKKFEIWLASKQRAKMGKIVKIEYCESIVPESSSQRRSEESRERRRMLIKKFQVLFWWVVVCLFVWHIKRCRISLCNILCMKMKYSNLIRIHWSCKNTKISITIVIKNN